MQQTRLVSTDAFATYYLRLDDSMLVNTRKSYGLLAWLASIGGLAKSVMAVFGLISFTVSYQMFISIVLENLFYIKKSLFSKAATKGPQI